MTIDLTRIDELKSICVMTGQSDAFSNMLQQFVDSLCADQVSLKTLTDGELEKVLHTLKGRCGTLGAIALSHAIAEAECAPLSLRESALDEVSVVLAQTIEAFRLLLKTHTSETK